MKQLDTAQARFKAFVPRRLEIAAVQKLLPMEDLSRFACLDVGAPDPVFSSVLRSFGGAWRSVGRSPAHAAATAAFLGEPVGCLGAGGALPLPDRSFDVIVVALDVFGAMPDPVAFAHECNRVLKPSGLLILSVQARRFFSAADALRRRRFPSSSDPYSASFTEASIYGLLKNGFDVQQLVPWSRMWLELARLREQRLLREGRSEAEVAQRTAVQYRIAATLDKLSFWARGHILTLGARRRRWSDRMAPVLSDGRSICEAVLFNPPA